MSVPYTLSLHFYGLGSPSNHIDLFFDVGEKLPLLHYKNSLSEVRKTSEKGHWEMHAGQPHRRVYLSFEGYVSLNRGKVRILRSGVASLPDEFNFLKPPEKIQVKCQNFMLFRHG